MRKLLWLMILVCTLAYSGTVKLRNGGTYQGNVKQVGNVVTVVGEKGIFQFRRRDVVEIDGVAMTQEKNPVVKISTTKGDLLVELFEDDTPNTVANFIELAEKGFYKGMAFHRVIPGFMAQGGCPYSKRGASGMPGTGGPGYQFDNECVPSLRHTGKGILSMANAGPNTNGSQFFLCFAATPWLDGKHTVFGKVIEGLDVLDKIEAVGSQSGRTREDVRFNVEVVSKRDHEYHVKTNK